MERLLLNKEQIVSLQLGMIKHVQGNVLQRGWKYFQDGNVVDVVHQNEMITAVVIGKEEHKVTLHISRFNKSSCTCSSLYCKHMSAVFFNVYAQYERRPELFLHQHQQLRLKKQQAKLKREKTRDKKLALATEQPNDHVTQTDSIELWHAFFAKRFKNFFSSSNQQVEGFYTEVLQDVLPLSKDWKVPQRQLFQLHALMFILKQTESYYISLRNSYLPFHLQQGCQYIFDRCIKSYIELIKEMSVAPLKQYKNKNIQETLNFLHDQAFHSKESLEYWMNIYRWFWWVFLDSAEWIEKEKNWLQRESTSSSKQRKYKLGIVHFEIMDGEDSQAMEQLNEWKAQQLADSLFYLKRFQESEQWDRLLRWLLYLFPYIHQRKQKAELNHYFKLWEQLMYHTDREGYEDWNHVMVALLPHSYPYLSDYFLNKAMYDHWIDLQLLMGYTPYELDSLTLREIEKSDPKLLLPLYHQSIEVYIQQKKRETYRNSAHLLKLLKRCYDQLDQMSRWELYIHQLSEKHLRLRAFQEELRKENLI